MKSLLRSAGDLCPLGVLAIFLILVPFLAASAPALAEVRVFLPLNQTYTTERSIALMGMVLEENWLRERDYVNVSVNGDELELDLRDGYFFAEEVYLDDGINRIKVEEGLVMVFAGDDEKPAPRYRSQYGHTTIDDSCDECHEPELDEADNIVGVTLLEPPDTLCNWCHRMLVSEGKSKALPVVHEPVVKGECGSCHDPHAGQRPAMLKAEPKEICRGCHQKVYEGMETMPYVHGPMNLGTCDLCHVTHAGSNAFLLKENEREVCLECHGGMGVFSRRKEGVDLHPGIDDGRCHECHSGHFSTSPKMMRKIVNNLCVECHPEKSHNFHEAKGFSIYICGRCHDVHQPDFRHLIVDESRDLCDQCHQVLGEGRKAHEVVQEESCFACHGFHLDPMLGTQMEICFQCHDQDGTFVENHPVGITPEVLCTGCHSPHSSLGEKLIYRNRHKPFAEGDCRSCHEWLDKQEAGAGGEIDLEALCFQCHPDKKIPEEKPAGLIVHKPFSRSGCLSCHLTHSSDHDYLLNADTLEVCGQCHSFVKKLRMLVPASIHPDVQKGRCGEGHNSHLNNRPMLLPMDTLLQPSIVWV